MALDHILPHRNRRTMAWADLYTLAVIQNCLAYGDQVRIAQAAQLLGASVVTYYPGDGLFLPKTVVIADDNDAILFLGGTSNYRQVLADVLDCYQTEWPDQVGGVHNYFCYVAETRGPIMWANAWAGHPNRKITLVGHSLGGAAATILYRLQTALFPDPEKRRALITFGAPRPGNPNFSNMLHPPVLRIINANDPIPLLPPDGFQSSLLTLNIADSLTTVSWGHARPGIVMRADGEVRQGHHAIDNSWVPSPLNPAAGVVNRFNAAVAAHQMTGYVNRIAQVQALQREAQSINAARAIHDALLAANP